MKTHWLLAALVAGNLLAGCVQDNSPVVFGNFKPFDPEAECAVTDDEFIVSGSGFLDLAGGAGYSKPVEVISQLAPVGTPAPAGGTIENPHSNEAIIERVQLEYATSNSLVTLANTEFPIHFVVSPGSTENRMTISFFPNRVTREALSTLPVGEQVTVFASVRMAGHVRSGKSFVSAPATFPITVTNSGAVCPAGTSLAPSAPCGQFGGFDNFPLICCPDTNPLCFEDTAP